MYNVGIFLFNNVELLDFAGPYEVFSDVSEVYNDAMFHVFTVSEEGQEIKSVNGLKILPDFSFADHPRIDILIIPGGEGTKSEIKKENVLKWVNSSCISSKMTMSVCSGARLLGKLGFLDNIECTTHHEVIEDPKGIAPKATVRTDKRFVSYDKISTSAGISAGIDLSLFIIEKLCGSSVANKVRVYMEYGDWEQFK
ncbi:MAG: DJ-1/PfpI family protein [Thermotaleaceae bacterium]